MRHLDSVLADIRDCPVPPELDGIDEQVFTGMAQLRERKTAVRSVALASAVALLVGVWTGNPQPGPSGQTLLGVPATAPSSLLAD
ncbi:hypothetical protein [Novosphingobium album (ex Hu et al. 2023)]|uniref:Uncharacterized protein n=1 Tax=Novosphingobium album (ex Hu et al. 2023) TaxID=2930093 RepID=A0ABT0B7R6_9SPHN|nr:hypothetical protein [Novosphingobium album (ex Hu et al. 2023)]MCJ2180930.1 hypothetical protein [Novosphingobium album (ex Hu et al. 2023)]